MRTQTNYIPRIFIFIGLFLCAYFLPAWITMIAALLPIMLYRNYLEFFVIVLLIDFLYAPAGNNMIVANGMLYIIIGAAMYMILTFLKTRLFIYQR